MACCQVTSERMVIDYYQVLVTSEHMVIDYSQVLVTSEHMVIDYSQVLVTSERMVIDYYQVLVTSERMVIDYSQVLVTSEHMVIDYSQVLVTSERMVIDYSQVLVTHCVTHWLLVIEFLPIPQFIIGDEDNRNTMNQQNEPRTIPSLFFDPDEHPEDTLKAFTGFVESFERRYNAQYPDPHRYH